MEIITFPSYSSSILTLVDQISPQSEGEAITGILFLELPFYLDHFADNEVCTHLSKNTEYEGEDPNFAKLSDLPLRPLKQYCLSEYSLKEDRFCFQTHRLRKRDPMKSSLLRIKKQKTNERER